MLHLLKSEVFFRVGEREGGGLGPPLSDFSGSSPAIDVLLQTVVMSQILRNESLFTTYLSLVILDPRRLNDEKNGLTFSKPNKPNGNQQSTLQCVQCTLSRMTASELLSFQRFTRSMLIHLYPKAEGLKER